MSKDSKEEGETISLPDGRLLGYLIVGEGKPVIYFHGLVESRLGAFYFKEVASSYNLQIIGVDRPGFGLSTLAPNRKISDFASDIRFLTSHLGIDKFALLGWSGGGPYVIACAAILAEHVTLAIAIGGISLPIDTSGMSRLPKLVWKMYTKPIIGPWLIKTERNQIFKMAEDLDAFLKSRAGRKMLGMLPEADKKLWTDHNLRHFQDMVLKSSMEGYRQGSNSIKAAIQEIKLFKKGWDVDLSRISPGLVHIWHGSLDMNVPVSNAYKNAEAIPSAHLEIFEGGGHGILFNNLEKLGEILSS